MAGSTSNPAALRELIAQGDAAATLDAVNLALTMSVARVQEHLDYDFLDGHAEQATRFFANWLARLQGFERMAAAVWVGPQYALSMVHLEHAYGLGARILMDALSEVTRATADCLEDFRLFTSGPDAEVSEQVADRLDRHAATVRAVQGELAAELELLPQHARRVAS
jgi:hypothetical protein